MPTVPIIASDSAALGAAVSAPSHLTARRVGAGIAGSVGLAAALGSCVWLVLAAAERASVLSPPTLRAHQPWLLGPLSGALPHLTTSAAGLHSDYEIALAVLFVAWILASAGAAALPEHAVWVVVVLCTAIFAFGPPQQITDVFNYVGYGSMATHGLNPYVHLPVAGTHGTLYALSNWHHLRSPYGPLFTFVTEPLSRLSISSALWVWKVIVVGSALGALVIVRWLAVTFGVSPQRAIVFAALCPATLAIGVGGFHNDGPMILCVVAAAACIVRGASAGTPAAHVSRWEFAAGLLVALAVGLKPSFAIAVPLIIVAARHRVLAAAGVAAGAAVAGTVMLAAFAGALPDLKTQAALVTPLSLPNLLGYAAGHGGADAGVRHLALLVLVVITAIATVAVALRRRWLLPALGVLFLASLLTLSWTMAWYLGWALPFVALWHPRILVPVTVVLCAWLLVASSPSMPQLIHRAGFYPTRTATGLANHQLQQRLVRR